MKKMIQAGLVIITIFLTSNTFSQTNESGSGKIKDGKRTAKTYLDLMVNVVSTNLNYGEANGTLTDYKKTANGIQAGASFQAGITPCFSIVSELYFMRKGGKLTINNPLTTSESSLRFNTIELPILARFHFGRFFMNAGPSIAYNLSGYRKIEDLSTKLSFTNSTESFQRFESGVQIGGGVEFPFKQKRIALDIRYNYGLTNLSNDKEIYNRAVMISSHFSKPWKRNPLGRNKSL